MYENYNFNKTNVSNVLQSCYELPRASLSCCMSHDAWANNKAIRHSGAIVQWQDRQYVGAFWGQNQGIPHILSMSNLYPAHPHKISLFCPWGHY